MPNPLNNAATANTYTDTATFVAQPAESVSVQVNNAAIDYTITTRKDGVIQSPTQDRMLLPGAWTFREGLDWNIGEKLVSISFKSHVAGTPAQVTAA